MIVKTTYPPNQKGSFFYNLILGSVMTAFFGGGILFTLILFALKYSPLESLLFTKERYNLMLMSIGCPPGIIIFVLSLYFFYKISIRGYTWQFDGKVLSAGQLKEPVTFESVTSISRGAIPPVSDHKAVEKIHNRFSTDEQHNYYEDSLLIFLNNGKVLILYLNFLEHGETLMNELQKAWAEKIDSDKSPYPTPFYIIYHLNKIKEADFITESRHYDKIMKKNRGGLKLSSCLEKVYIVISVLIIVAVTCYFSLLAADYISLRFFNKELFGITEDSTGFALLFTLLFFLGIGIFQAVKKAKKKKKNQKEDPSS